MSQHTCIRQSETSPTTRTQHLLGQLDAVADELDLREQEEDAIESARAMMDRLLDDDTLGIGTDGRYGIPRRFEL